jgi:hypothetical protein
VTVILSKTVCGAGQAATSAKTRNSGASRPTFPVYAYRFRIELARI